MSYTLGITLRIPSEQAMEQGERRIAELGKNLTLSGTVVQLQEQLRYFVDAIVISRLRLQPLIGILSSRACHTAECQTALQPPNNQLARTAPCHLEKLY